MDQGYWLRRKRASVAKAHDSDSAEARLIHFDLAGRYAVKAAECGAAPPDPCPTPTPVPIRNDSMVNTILAPEPSALAAERNAEQTVHHAPVGFSDRFALGFTKLLRFCADTFFAKRYGHRAIVLETVAAVPGMVGAMFTHLSSLRRMKDDEGWIRTLLEEAENERMHLMTFIEIAQPTLFERLVILLAQWVFLVLFSILYLFSSKTAHRVVGYFEEEAVISYTLYLKEIDEGRSPNVPAPAIARHYWKMADDATLRDVVLLVRADEAHHRDVNHGYSSKLGGRHVDRAVAAPYPAHADDIRVNA